ncbi:ubiquinone biosynthesis O-methyltransferase [Acrasis kona]|uniref:Ubiquinone biosynthesis O-methyltransferase n=1 Tax=Acrasis kona TaxID=1008807 RepID=A0AAW2YZM3_9EUKA
MTHQTATDVQVNLTLENLKRFLPPAPASILEIGCGSGQVSKALMDLGYTVTAVEPDEKSSEKAKVLGVNVTVMDFLKFEPNQQFDFIFSILVLHHIPDLVGAVQAIKKHLKPNGTVYVEEFHLSIVDHDTSKWFFDHQDLLEIAEVTSIHQHGGHHHGHHSHNHHAHNFKHHSHDGHRMTPEERWKSLFAHFQPKLHDGPDMIEQLKTLNGDIQVESCPLFFRLIGTGVDERRKMGTSRSEGSDHKIAQKILQMEQESIAEQKIKPFGLRVVVSNTK